MIRWATTLAAFALAIAVVRSLASDDSSASPRSARPPGPGDPRPVAGPEPTMPVITASQRAAIANQVRGSARPGEDAFRAVSDRYVDENLALAERQAAAEGMTLAEIRELTHFGLLVLATQRAGDVEDLIGRELTSDERRGLGELMRSANDDFRQAMRSLVARGGTEAQRGELIRATQARYRSELFRITGLDDALLDDLLAGNLALPGAPSRGEPPSGTPAAGGRDELTAAPTRPVR